MRAALTFLVTILAFSTSYAATKADMALAAASCDFERVYKIVLSQAQPAMVGLVSIDVVGKTNGKIEVQSLYIYSDAAKPSVQQKFLPREIEPQAVP